MAPLLMVRQQPNRNRNATDRVQATRLTNGDISMNIPLPGAGEVNILQADGKIVKTLQVSQASHVTIARNQMNPGVYIVSVKGALGHYSDRFLIY